MTNLIRIYPDMTFTEKKVKTWEDKIQLDKHYTPEFKIGTSVFKERAFNPLKKILMFWKKPRNLLLLVDACPSAVHLEGSNPHPALAFNFGTMKDTEKFLYKVVAKSKSESKPISNTQFLVLALLLGAVLMFQFMLMKGITI